LAGAWFDPPNKTRKIAQENAMNDALQRLIDKDEIRDLMSRYARGVDRADWDGVRETYHKDAYDDHGDYKGGTDGFIEFGRSRTNGATQVMHFLGECLIEFASPTVAIVETYFMTAHTLGPEAQRQYGATNNGGPVQLSHYGRYADRVEKRDGIWRIAHRIVIFEATRLMLGEVPPIKPTWAAHRRDKSDPIFKLRTEAGIA
jgi:cation transport regulator ChaB